VCANHARMLSAGILFRLRLRLAQTDFLGASFLD
jgi:hypothetical protein